MNITLPTAIIGGGPVALAAAAHLVQRKMPFVLFERGAEVGASVLSWKHVRMFSPWAYNVDRAANDLLTESGWIAPDKDGMPTGGELVRLYLEPLSQLEQIKPYVKLESTVKAIHRKGFDKMKTAGRGNAPFVIEYELHGEVKRVEAGAVIDATGTWLTPNPMGASGNQADGETQNADRIAYGIPDVLGAERERYAGKNVAIVGSGHSAIQALTMLYELKRQSPATEIHWVLRKKNAAEAFGGGEKDGLPARGELGTRARLIMRGGDVTIHSPFLVHRVVREADASTLTLSGTSLDKEYAVQGIDEVIVAAGTRPDFSFLRELRYAADSAIESVPQLAELIDPNIHSCGTVRPHGEAELRQPEPNFYIVGSKSYGRAPTFLLATGYEQVRSVVAALAGDEEAAREVKLELPETGVCSVSRAEGAGQETEDSCCGPKRTSYQPIGVINSGCCGS